MMTHGPGTVTGSGSAGRHGTVKSDILAVYSQRLFPAVRLVQQVKWVIGLVVVM